MSSLKYEAANRPHHTCRAADRDGPRRLRWGGSDCERITQTERGTCWWKLILKGWYLLSGAEKDVHVCAMNTDFKWFGLNGGRIWYKEWFGLLAMVLRRPASAVPANCYTVLTWPESCHRCALPNNPFIRPMSSWVNRPNQDGKAYRTRDTTIAWNTVAKPCSSNPACFSLLSK